MKALLYVSLLLGLSTPAMADDYAHYGNEELRKLCEFQKQSLQKKYNGTPACDALKKRRGRK